MKKLNENLLDKLEFCQKLTKMMARINTITSFVDIGLITLTVDSGDVSIVPFSSGVGLPVGIAFPSLETAITEKVFKIFTRKQKKTITLS